MFLRETTEPTLERGGHQLPAVARFCALTHKEQPIAEHLKNVEALCARASERFGAGAAGALTGLLHDLGKYQLSFRAYIHSAAGRLSRDSELWVDAKLMKGQVDHSTAGAALLWHIVCEHTAASTPDIREASRLASQLMAAAIASHHSGLVDQISPDGSRVFLRRLLTDQAKADRQEVELAMDVSVRRGIQELLAPALESLAELASRIRHLETTKFRDDQVLARDRISSFKLGMLQKMLLSALVDSDRLDSARFAGGSPDAPAPYPTWELLLSRLEESIKDLPTGGGVNAIRARVSDACASAGKTLSPGLYTLTVPTGGGKTLAGLRFGLHHALAQDMDRLVFVTPFTSIIEQSAEVARKALERPGDDFMVVLEHHSNLEPTEATRQNSQLSENWDAPVVHTTLVQLLNALFGLGTSSARRLCKLARAVVVFDEIQTLPVRCVHIFNNAINFLVEHSGATVVLCTATQPLLHRVDPTLGAARLAPHPELVPNTQELFEGLRRVSVLNRLLRTGWTNEMVAKLALEEQALSGSCLVILNTRRTAVDTFRHIKRMAGALPVFHLSTTMCPAHRRDTLRQVKLLLDTKQPVLCVSTQVIEAGVDVDFGSVIRAMAGLDSIAQASGRCNRNGLAHGRVTLVNLVEEKLHMLPDISVGRDAGRKVIDARAQVGEDASWLIEPEALERYFDAAFHRRASEMSYPVDKGDPTGPNVLDMLSTNTAGIAAYKLRMKPAAIREPGHMQQAFASAAAVFKAIESETVPVLVPYSAAADALFEQIRREAQPNALKQLLRRAQQFTVSVAAQRHQELRERGAISPLGAPALDIFLASPHSYSADCGLYIH